MHASEHIQDKIKPLNNHNIYVVATEKVMVVVGRVVVIAVVGGRWVMLAEGCWVVGGGGCRAGGWS